jgi:peptide/nickel transport system substrate-binding protein
MSTEIPTPENGWTGLNYVGYSNPAYDAACRRAREALPGEPEYVQYHQVAQRIWAADLPSLPLYMRIKVAASRPQVYGFLLDPTTMSEMWNVEKIKVSSQSTSTTR